MKSFGLPKAVEGVSARQSRWLTEGRVLIGPDDTIHYVFLNSPAPSYASFTSDGALIGEYTIDGGDIPFQSSLALRLLEQLRNAPDDCTVVGVRVLVAATIDQTTGNLWFLGSGGWLYEYRPSGQKMAEHRIDIGENDSPVVDIAVDGS